MVLTRDTDVAKKKSEQQAKPASGTLIRVSDEFAEAIRDAIGFEHMSTAAWIDLNLLAIVRKKYEDAVLRKAKKIEGKG